MSEDRLPDKKLFGNEYVTLSFKIWQNLCGVVGTTSLHIWRYFACFAHNYGTYRWAPITDQYSIDFKLSCHNVKIIE